MLQFSLVVCLGLLIYTYAGYGILITLLVKTRHLFKPVSSVLHEIDYTPQVTLVIRACNKMTCLPAKLQNLDSLDYPIDKLSFLFLTEGSTDGSTEWLESLRDDGARQINVQKGVQRTDKVTSVNRAMKHITSPIVIYSAVNTQLNSLAVRNLVRHFQDDSIGAVVGEQRISKYVNEPIGTLGERLCRAFESYLNRQDTLFHATAGAADALLAIRATLYQPIQTDTILDKFIISMGIAGKGYRVPYEPDAYTLEWPPLSIDEKQKRDVTLAAGRFQSVMHLVYLANIARYGWLSFQYVSRWVLRWAVAPFCLPIIWFSNLLLILPVQSQTPQLFFWVILFISQCIFYGLAYIGYRLQYKERRINVLQLPFYITFINMCALRGFMRYCRSISSGIWNKARRTDTVELQPTP